jgi:hypothetical protein
MDEPTNKLLVPFTPAPVRYRRGGWTVEKHIAFSARSPSPRAWARIRARRTVNFGNFRLRAPAACVAVTTIIREHSRASL